MNAFYHVWSVLDKFYYLCSRLEYTDKHEQHIFRVRLLKYRGEDLTLSDGTIFTKGDLLLKIHLHNCVLMKEMQKLDHDVKRALYTRNRVLQSLPGLAAYLSNHPNKNQIKGIIGITLLTRGVKHLGFEVNEIKNPVYRNFKASYLVPMYFLCHAGSFFSTLRKKEVLRPKYLVMSSDQLIKKYSDGR